MAKETSGLKLHNTTITGEVLNGEIVGSERHTNNTVDVSSNLLGTYYYFDTKTTVSQDIWVRDTITGEEAGARLINVDAPFRTGQQGSLLRVHDKRGNKTPVAIVNGTTGSWWYTLNVRAFIEKNGIYKGSWSARYMRNRLDGGFLGVLFGLIGLAILSAIFAVLTVFGAAVFEEKTTPRKADYVDEYMKLRHNKTGADYYKLTRDQQKQLWYDDINLIEAEQANVSLKKFKSMPAKERDRIHKKNWSAKLTEMAEKLGVSRLEAIGAMYDVDYMRKNLSAEDFKAYCQSSVRDRCDPKWKRIREIQPIVHGYYRHPLKDQEEQVAYTAFGFFMLYFLTRGIAGARRKSKIENQFKAWVQNEIDNRFA